MKIRSGRSAPVPVALRAKRSERESRGRATFGAAAIGVAITDLDGRFQQVNDAYCALTGYPASALYGRDVSVIVHPGDVRPFQHQFRALLDGRLPNVTIERRYVRPDGTLMRVHNILSLMRDASGNPTNLVAVAQDVTKQKAVLLERQELERRLLQDEKLCALGQVAVGVAHDVNNALAAIAGPAEQLRDSLTRTGHASDGELRDLDVLVQAADDAGQTVRRLLAFARPEHDSAADEQRLIAPDDLLEDAVALTRPRWRDRAGAEGRRIAVDVLRGGAPQVRGDPAELREALVNLLNNAADALPEGGRITVASAAGAGDDGASQAILSVADNGLGIVPATRSRLFEPFFTTKPPGKGTGLGLMMVHGIVSRLGGSIQVESVPGKGTVVTLRLPAAIPSPTSAGTLGIVAPGRHVLLVEDEPALRAVVDRLLSADGHTVVGFADAEAALAALEQPVGNGFDAVITDLGLPGISGWQFLEALHDRFSALPVVVATGWAAQIDDRRLQRCGIPRDQIIGKPYRRDELLAALGHVLGTGANGAHS